MAVTWNYENAAHLLSRSAFGGSPETIQDFLDDHASVESAVDQVLEFADKPKKSKPPAKKDDDTDTLRKMQRWWLKKMIKYKRPRDGAREKLVLFLHDHLVSGTDKIDEFRWLSYQNRLFRMTAGGNFKQLIRDLNRDPANLFFLDGIINFASSDGVNVTANENWGREVVELFTLGVFQLQADGTPDPTKPTYTESDVHNLARASTGWVDEDFVKIKGQYHGVWDPSAYDGGNYDDDGDGNPDTMTIFGQSSDNFRLDEAVADTSDDILKLIFDRVDDSGNNQVGMFLASKLWTWYAYPPANVDPLVGAAPNLGSLFATFAAEFDNNNFALKPMLRAMFTCDDFYSDEAKRRTVKSPADYVVSAMRAFNVRGSGKQIGDGSRELGELLERMGMTLFSPPNVAGWPGGLSWVNAGTLLERMEFAKDLAAAEFGASRIKFKKVEALPLGNPAADPAVIVDIIVHQMSRDIGPTAISLSQRQDLIDYATTEEGGGTLTTLDISNEFTSDFQKVRGLVALVMQMAESHVQ